MGAKLCNLHIYNPGKREYSVASGYSVVRIAEGWDTIYEDEQNLNYNKMAKMARDLSKELDRPVISVNYFDDDVFELSVTVEGKKTAYYCVNYGRIFSKKIPAMIEALRLDDKDAKAFRYLVRKEMTAPEAIDSISGICGLPLYSDMFMYKETPDKLIPDKESVHNDIKKDKARNIISSVKAELLEEFPGATVYYYCAPSSADNYEGIIRTVKDPLDYGKVDCYQITEGQVPYLKKVYDYYIPIHEYTGKPKNTNIWIIFRQKGTMEWYLDFDQPPCYGYYSTCDEKEIEKINALSIIPEENLSRASYEFGERLSNIDTEKLPESYKQELIDTDKGIYVKRYNADRYKRQGDYIVRPSYYTEYGYDSIAEYARIEFWNNNYELVRSELVPIDFFKTSFPLIQADFAYIEEQNTVVYGNYVIDLTKKTLTINDQLPEKNYFIEKRTIGGKPLLIIGAAKYIHIFDHDLKRLQSFSIKGRCVSWFFDSNDDLFVVTSTIFHGSEDRGMKASDRIRLYKIQISQNIQ